MHFSDDFYHNFLYQCPNDKKFYRLKVKISHIFLILTFYKFGCLEAQKGLTPLRGEELGPTPVPLLVLVPTPLPLTGVGSNAIREIGVGPKCQSHGFSV